MRWTLRAAIVAAIFALSVIPALPSYSAPSAPTGVTAIALDGKVGLAWQAVTGATSYQVLRGTSAGSVTTSVGTSSSPSFTDTTATNGTAYYYAVRAVGAGTSPSSNPVQATPRLRSCTTGNTIAIENCFPGTANWKSGGSAGVGQGGIEGFATATSVNAGQSVDLKVNTQDGQPYQLEIYRSGYYGGTQGRLISTLPSLTGELQPACSRNDDTTGLIDCSNWDTSYRLTTTADWPSGVYLIKMVRTDNGSEDHILLTVRNDSATTDGTYVVPVSTYQAYNNWGGKSLYDFNSNGANTVAGTPRAVKVSYDRPYNGTRDWYTEVDVQNVSWFEREGYNLNYATSLDLHTGLSGINQRKVLISPSHDEYWSAQMRQAFTSARDAGVGLMYLGANADYWKIRFEANPYSGAANRVEVAYKTTQSGPVDPQGPTGTWRDPAGANNPESNLIGQQYIGDNDNGFFPLKVTAAQGRNRVWRYTSLNTLPAGGSDIVGSTLVGWEWDSTTSGPAPAGLQTLAASPVSGSILQDAGRVYAPGSAEQNTTLYKAASGAIVFATGTNHWSRGLGLNMRGVGEPTSVIMQATANVLQDMGVKPASPDQITLDAAGAPSLTARTPAPAATGVATTANVTATFDRPLDPATVDGTTAWLTNSGGGTVPADVSYDASSRTITIDPSTDLDGVSTYTAHLATGIKGWNGQGLGAATTWSFTTRGGNPPVVTSQTPASGATGVSFATSVKATFDRALDPSTLTTGTFTLTPAGGSPISASVSYDAATRTATLQPAAMLNPSTSYSARLTTAITASDGAPLAADVTWSFTTKAAPGPFTVTSRTPAPLGNGISPSTNVRAVFSRSVDPATITTSSFKLTAPGGQTVAAGVSYDESTLTATLTPNAPLAASTTYTVDLTGAVRGLEDGAALSPVSWTFTTALSAPPAPIATSTSPAASETNVDLSAPVKATFDRSLDPATVTSSSFTLTPQGGTPVLASVSYDDATRTATLTPVNPLSVGTSYGVRMTTAIRSSVGTPLSSDLTWSFTTRACPCTLFPSNLQPALRGLDTRDGRGGSGPWTYELGVKFRVDATVQLAALKFFKDAAETGTHVGRLWDSSGNQITSVTYANEGASGWQRQNLPSAVTLVPGQTYIATVNVNSRWVATQGQLTTSTGSGPLHTIADGANGVHADAAGQFPTHTYQSTNYFIDVVVKTSTSVLETPHVAGVFPQSGATGASTTGTVRATFDIPMNRGTINASTFTLTRSGGVAVPATVTYDDDAKTATLTPASELANSTTYTARVDGAVKSEDDVALGSATSWSFTTAADPVPNVTATSPTSGATQVSGAMPITATFDQALDPATVTSSTFTLETAGGTAVPASVAWNASTKTATLTPSAALAASTDYVARVTTGMANAKGTHLASTVNIAFTTNPCPCQLFPSTLSPQITHLDTRDGRGGSGPWTYEMGVKFTVSSPAQLTAIRYWRDSSETGTHIGRLWNATGTQLATTTFAGETAQGWQEQALSSPVTLTPGQTYVVSVGINAFFVDTLSGLASSVGTGPLRSVADGANGVHSGAAGQFPTSAWSNSNYWVEPVVR
jgi:N,N-dimethylformamidase beta subunit-like, C-terminal/Domain of unknown function (DUF4082)/Bacterial Ig-like domain